MKKHKLILIITGAVFVISVILSVWILKKSDRTMIEIVQNGTVLHTIDLNTAKDQDIRIDAPDGSSYNIVSIRGGTVSVSEAGCPDQTCVKMGILQSDHLPIVCLPNKLIVRFAEGGAS